MKKFSDIIQKQAKAQEEKPDDIIKGRFKIAKSDDEKMLAFGWASVSMRVDGEVIEDWQKDIVEPDELENAAYEFVKLYREGGEMHERSATMCSQWWISVRFRREHFLLLRTERKVRMLTFALSLSIQKTGRNELSAPKNFLTQPGLLWTGGWFPDKRRHL